MSQSWPTPVTGHSIYISGLFEVEEKISQEQGWDEEARTYVVSIGCSGINRMKPLLYEIRATGYSSPRFTLMPNHVYFLRGNFFPTNGDDTTNDLFYFEAPDATLIVPTKNLSQTLEDAVAISGCGIILTIDTIVEECMQHLKLKDEDEDKITTVITVQHSDYHPITKAPEGSVIEYRIRPYRHLSGTRKIIKIGREINIHGYVKDFDEEALNYVVNKLSVTSGHQEPGRSNKSNQASKGSKPGFQKGSRVLVVDSSDEAGEQSLPNTASSSASNLASQKPAKYKAAPSAGSSIGRSTVTAGSLHSAFKSPLIPPTSKAPPSAKSSFESSNIDAVPDLGDESEHDSPPSPPPKRTRQTAKKQATKASKSKARTANK